MSVALLIYTTKDTSRIRYTFSLFFESLIKTTYKLTTDVSEYSAYDGPKLNYSEKPIASDEIFIHSSTLLCETGIKQQQINVSEWQGLKVFCQTEGGAMPFDVFAASFYLVSRYEEYLPFSPDKFERFKPTDSIAFKNKFIDIPLVNLWAEELKKIIRAKFSALEITENKYTFTPTIDIDVAYAHKGRKIGITLGSYMKALLKLNIGFIYNKSLALLGLRPDEYDTYRYQQEIFKKYSLRPLYFFLAGNWSRYDKNINVEGNYFSSLIKKVDTYADVGIHPSFMSVSAEAVVKDEINRVQKNLSSKITKSRQHFLRIMLPDTYRCLAKLGIADDFTMAYAGCPGFRAGICTPFYFYDLQKEEVLPVKIHSTAIMDGTLREYLLLSPDEAIALAKKLIEQVKKVNGEFICIWHNDTLNDSGKWKGWRRVFETMMEFAK